MKGSVCVWACMLELILFQTFFMKNISINFVCEVFIFRDFLSEIWTNILIWKKYKTYSQTGIYTKFNLSLKLQGATSGLIRLFSLRQGIKVVSISFVRERNEFVKDFQDWFTERTCVKEKGKGNPCLPTRWHMFAVDKCFCQRECKKVSLEHKYVFDWPLLVWTCGLTLQIFLKPLSVNLALLKLNDILCVICVKNKTSGVFSSFHVWCSGRCNVKFMKSFDDIVNYNKFTEMIKHTISNLRVRCNLKYNVFQVCIHYKIPFCLIVQTWNLVHFEFLRDKNHIQNCIKIQIKKWLNFIIQ